MHTIIILSSRKEEEMDMHFREQLHRLFPDCRIKVVQKYPEEGAASHSDPGMLSHSAKEI